MIFRKKRKMIDVRELQKRGVVRLPKTTPAPKTTSEGFVDLANNKPKKEETQSNANFFGLMETPTSTPTEETFSTSPDGYNKREVDAKVTDLDNKIYKLEQRIELLEKKLQVNQNPSPAGVMGW